MERDGVVRVGEKLLLVERKRFAEGRSRGLVGTVEAVSGDLIRLHGLAMDLPGNALGACP